MYNKYKAKFKLKGGNRMEIGLLLATIIINVIIGFIQLMLFVKVYRTTDALTKISAEYLEKVTLTSIDVIKKTEQSHQS